MNGILESSDEQITAREGFLAMCDFLWDFANGGNDLLTLLGDTEIKEDGRPTDLAAWSDWLKSLRKIQAGGKPREPRPTDGYLTYTRHDGA